MEAKAKHLEEMETELKELSSRIERLEAKIRKKHEEVKTHLEEVSDLRAKHRTARERLEQIRKATHDEWDSLKSGWEETVKDMQEALDRVTSRY